MQAIFESRLFKMATVCALVLGVMVAGFANGGKNSVQAHEDLPQTFMVQAGVQGVSNVEVLAFGPSVLQVHRGDSVMWHINSFHNLHLGETPAEMAIFPIVDGQPLPQLNPAIAFPTMQDGGVYTGGDANNGFPAPGTTPGTFTLTIDAPEGRYMYFCDIHPGMVGVIEVVADDVEIPSPDQVYEQGRLELNGYVGAGMAAIPQIAENTTVRSEDGVLNIVVGSGGTGRATVNLFSSYVGIVEAGETVTWTVPADSIEPHFVNSTPYDPAAVPEVVPQEQPDGPPLLLLGPGFLGTTESGATIKAGDTFNSAFIVPGQSFSLTFADAGVYEYECHIHPGMKGVIVVEAAAA